MRGVVGVLLCVGLTSCLGYRIDPCDDNQEVQIDEAGDAVFTCTGITAVEVRWRMTDTDNRELLLFGTCISNECTVPADDCSISTPQFNTSVLNVTGDYRRVAGTVECAGMNGGQIQGSATCKVKVVYTSYNVNYTTRVTTPGWTVSGSCDVDKIYTSDGNYNCHWQQKGQSAFPGQTSLYPYTDSGTGQEYNRMTCPFTAPMPTTDGTYDYILTIDPRKIPDETHKGQSIAIWSPKGPPVLHNCPRDVVEGENVSCTCQASASEPPALVTWSSYSGNAVGNTATLPLHSVHTALGGHSSTCSQFWAGFDTTHKKETNYTINVMYPPPSPPVIRGITNYTAGDSVNLTCTVTGGNPPVTSVTFYCGDHGDGDDVTSTAEGQTAVTSAAVVSSLAARDSGSVCRCSGVWSARPSLYATTSTVTITVHDEKSDDDDNDSSVAFIVGGAVGATVVIIIALVIVVVITRRRRGKPQNEEDKRNATDDEDEFVEHINSMYQSADDPDLDQTRPSAVALRIQSAGNGNADPQDPQARDWHSGPSAPSGRPAHGEADSDLYSSADQPVTHPDPDMAMGPYASVGELDDSAHQRADVGLYSSADGGVDNPSFVIEEHSAHQPQNDNAYAVVNKSKKTPDPQNTEYAVVKKPRATLQQPAQPAGSASGEDDPADNVYAQVNKKSKGSHPVSPRPPEGEVENDAKAQTPQTTGKPLPAAKPGPLVAAKPPVPVKPQQTGTATNHDNENPRQGRSLVTSDYEDVDQMTDTAQDDYNALAFHRRPSPELSANPESDYSHIGAV